MRRVDAGQVRTQIPRLHGRPPVIRTRIDTQKDEDANCDSFAHKNAVRENAVSVKKKYFRSKGKSVVSVV